MDYKDLEAGNSSDYFWFKAKTDLIHTFMKMNLGERNDLNILNIGAGTGDDLKVLKNFGKNYVIDIDANALAVIDNDLCEDKQQGDACNLPYENNFFDVVIACDVFEHINDHLKAISEAHRVLQPNGILLFTVPAFQSLYSSHDKALDHFRRYNKKTITQALTPFGKKKMYYWNTLLFPPAALSRLIRKNAPPKVDHPPLGKWMNDWMYGILKVDNFLIKNNLSLPAGLSIVGYCYK
jgi:ubiquinone/menaquinone biosynthesis C-methylase UbiE